MSVVLTISELPPSVNGMFFNNPSRRGPGRIKTKAYRTWREVMAWEVRQQRPPHYSSRVSVSVSLPQATRGDADNRIKACLDLLQEAGVVLNDKQCDPVSIGRADVQQTTITITEVV